jgi:hypothetical protein
MKTSPASARNLLMAVVYFSLAAFFSGAFYERFWIWRHEIASVNTSYVTPDGMNVTSGGMLWAAPALLFLFAGVWRMIRYARTKKPSQVIPSGSVQG